MKQYTCISTLFLASLAFACSAADGVDGFEAIETGMVEQALPGDPVCGDGYLDIGEQCDDGNTNYNDGCGSTCQIERVVSVAPGSHKIKNLQNKCLDVAGVSQTQGANVIEWSCHGNNNQRWELRPSWAGGFYEVVVKHSGKCLSLATPSYSVGTNVVQVTCDSSKEETLWAASGGGGPYFSLVNLYSDRCLSVENGSAVQSYCDGLADEQWIQELIGVDIPSGFGTLKNRADGRCADISGASQSDGGDMIVWQCHGGSNQDFEFTPSSGEFYNIKLRHSAKCVDVVPTSVLGGVDGQNARQWTCDSDENQQFIPVATDSGYFELRAKHSDMCLDVTPGGISVIQKRCNGSPSQQWTR